jgi:hypothetical protein
MFGCGSVLDVRVVAGAVFALVVAGEWGREVAGGVVAGALVGDRGSGELVVPGDPVPAGRLTGIVGRSVAGTQGSKPVPDFGGTGGISEVTESGGPTIVPAGPVVGGGVSAVLAPAGSVVGDGLSAVLAPPVVAARPACGLPATVVAHPAASSTAMATVSTVRILRMPSPSGRRGNGGAADPVAVGTRRCGAVTHAGAGRLPR